MDEAQMATLFNRFQTKQSSGNGLGLSIVKSIADFLGIVISVTGTTGRGTTIMLFFDTEFVGTNTD